MKRVLISLILALGMILTLAVEVGAEGTGGCC